MPARLPCFRFAAPRSSRLRIATLAALGIALAASPGVAGEVMVVGSPHLSALRPEPGPERLREVVERLASWAPTVVCVEAIPGERVRQLAGDPETWGDLLSVFALDAIRLAPEQQARLSVDGATALRLAREPEARPSLTEAERVRLVGWMSSPDFTEADRRSQRDLFARGGMPNRAGERRLALWRARNAEIAAHVYRAVAGPDGARTLLVIGASHRPFLEAALRAQPWIDVVPPAWALGAGGR